MGLLDSFFAPKTKTQPFNFKELNPPITQRAEALYLLIQEHPRGVTRAKAMSMAGILNYPACIQSIREKGVPVVCDRVETINRFGRDVSYGVYRIPDKAFKKAVDVYNELNA